MLSYHVKIRTKLGSIRAKDINANSEEEAIAAAKQDFPLHESIWIEGTSHELTDSAEKRSESQERIAAMKRDAEIAKAKSKRSEGLIWLGIGLFLTLVTFLFVRNAFIISFGPVIWGAYMFRKADKQMKALQADENLNFS